ncbi:MAG: alpha/beta hydrolase [Sphingobacteriales bacterium]|nr:alpha/beta hydrolase [Sphingobacteriales bacterium]
MRKLLPAILFIAYNVVVHAQTVRIVVNDQSAGSATHKDLFIAGSFNGWNPGDGRFKFQPGDNGSYLLELSLATGSYEYKITRGSWDKVECKAGGAGIANRVLNVKSDTLVQLTVEEWADKVPPKPRVSTAGAHVQILDTAFYSPQLKRTRRVWIYLPPHYSRNKKYPVLYMHDGQNVFEDTTAYSGEWGVDEYLDSAITRPCIVVAVDHGGAKRLNEYNPYNSERFGTGEGDAYVDFIVKTLKPFIDKKYKPARGRNHTFIAGSSMGGLISMYAILKYPRVFGGAGVFSPAFWVAPGISQAIKKRGKKFKGKLYLYAGMQEGETMVPLLLKAFEELTAVSKAGIAVVIRNEGMHNETRWRQEFPLFYQWLTSPGTPSHFITNTF